MGVNQAGGARPERERLSKENARRFAARIATILQDQLESEAYAPGVEQAWEAMPAGTNEEEFNRLILWAARLTKRREDKRPSAWFRYFKGYVERGIRERVWESEGGAPLPDQEGPAEKRRVANSPEMVPSVDTAVGDVRPLKPADHPEEGPRENVADRAGRQEQSRELPRGRQPKSLPKEAEAAEAAKRQAPVWGKGSVRLGPGWTTGTKDAKYYEFAFVRLDDEDKK